MFEFSSMVEEDLAFFLEIYTDRKVMQFVEGQFDRSSAKKLFNIVQKQSQLKNPKSQFYIISINNNKIGLIGIIWNQPVRTSVELGLMIAGQYQRMGYANQLMVDFMGAMSKEKGIVYYVAYSQKNNLAANVVLKRTGFLLHKKTLGNKYHWVHKTSKN